MDVRRIAIKNMKLIDSYSEDNKDSFDAAFNGSINFYAQSFLNADICILDSCKWFLSKFGSPTGNIYAQIYAHSGTYGTNSVPTGSALAVSDPVDVSTLTAFATFGLKMFTFSGSNRIILSAGTYYELVLTYNGGNDSNCPFVGFDASTPTAPGNSATSNGGISWSPNNGRDMCFYVYGEVAPIIRRRRRNSHAQGNPMIY
jgi:hypothetical protein